MKIPPGYVACRSQKTSNQPRVLLHLMKVDLSATVCGKYRLDDILPEDEQIPDGTRQCRSCIWTLANTKPKRQQRKETP